MNEQQFVWGVEEAEGLPYKKLSQEMNGSKTLFIQIKWVISFKTSFQPYFITSLPKSTQCAITFLLWIYQFGYTFYLLLNRSSSVSVVLLKI